MKTTTGLASISFWIWSFTLPSAANFLRCGMKSLSEQSVRAGPGRAAASRAAAGKQLRADRAKPGEKRADGLAQRGIVQLDHPRQSQRVAQPPSVVKHLWLCMARVEM
mmetsp:Transcript_27876/g.91689  ORF Transcript_27876/g.91689 Transcript_27876/m.91689 type:complete len:108 (-) Transcript_27876:737-1060(-)